VVMKSESDAPHPDPNETYVQIPSTYEPRSAGFVE
jgi:hypothetical protein